MLFMFAQNPLISYHTETFVKTEVGCTVNPLCMGVVNQFVYTHTNETPFTANCTWTTFMYIL